MRKVTLTFDNGPDPEITPRVLDILGTRGLRAHFFVLGKNIARDEGRRLIDRALAEGHLVGNHSFSHETPLGNDERPDAVEREIVATERLLEGVPGERRFRPFGGGGLVGPHLLSRAAADYLVAQRYSCVLWSSVPKDWVDQKGWVTTALAQTEAQPHAVVVLHDIADACLARLEQFLDALHLRGDAIVLDLPPACLPIDRGRVTGDLASLIAT